MNKQWLLITFLVGSPSRLVLASEAGISTGVTQGADQARPTKGLPIPAIVIYPSTKEVYTTDARPQLLLILHVPRQAGPVYVELHNRTAAEISYFAFTLSSLGHEGDLEFEDLPAGWSAMKEVKLNSLRELAIRNAKAINQNADEIQPRLVIRQIEWLGKPPKAGRRKL